MWLVTCSVNPSWGVPKSGASFVSIATKFGTIPSTSKSKWTTIPTAAAMGAVMQADPLYQCWNHICQEAGERLHTIYLSPAGTVFQQADAKRLQRDYQSLILVCGHYEGIDERFIEECVDEEFLWVILF